MYLKSIEVQGFKSFANKIVFDFHNGITGIVGPNGSGKSNVADAVRWVLGEQRVKQLRGGNMQDVIFSGTELRKPLSYASVAITLDNSDHHLPIEYEEVTIARKLYRSGESEYLINGSICRLKDVNELFYDTGIGKEGYSIIGQGQIDKILSGKPEERRELFDEAAGIVKFKRRKNMSVKKLEEERQNLVRVNDILSELEKQVGPLAKQSEVAKEYLKKKEALKTYDINMFLMETERLKAELTAVEEKIKIAQDELDSVTIDYEKTKAEYEEIELKTDEIDDSLEISRQQLSKTTLLKQQLESQIQLLNEQINTARMNDEHIKQRTDVIHEELNKRQENLKMLAKEKALLEAQISESLSAEKTVKDILSRYQNKIIELSDAIESKKQELIGLLNARSSMKVKSQRYTTLLEQVQVRRSELHQRVILINSETEKDRESYHKYENEWNEVSNIIQKKIDETNLLEKEIKELQSLISQKTEEHSNLQKTYHREESRLDSLKNMTERYEGYGNSIRKVMEKKKEVQGILGVVADIIKVSKNYEVAIETALGGSIQNIVTDKEETAKQMITYLKQNKLGRATFLPLTSVNGSNYKIQKEVLNEKGVIGIASSLVQVEEKYKGLAENLLGRTFVVDHIDHAISLARKYKQTLRIVTLEGDLMNPGGAMTGGAFKNASNLLSRRREIEELELVIQDLRKKINSAGILLEDAKGKRTSYYESIDEIKRELQKAYVVQNTAKINKDQTEKKLLEAQDELEYIQSENEKIESQMKNLKKENQLIQDELTASEKSEDDLNTISLELQRQLDETRNDESKQMQESEKIHLAYAALEQKQQFNQENEQRILQEISLFNEELDSLAINKENASVDIINKEAQIQDIQKTIDDSKELFEEIEKDIKKYTTEKEELTKKSKAFITKREELSKRSSELDKELFRLTSRRDGYEEASEKHINYMWDEYELTYNMALEIRDDSLNDLAFMKKQIQIIKNEIRALGSVNVNAIEDYKNVSERYEFMKTQHDDLVEAEETLMKIIDELDTAMRKQFRERFEEISIEFDKVFKQLFGGGKGTLELMEDQDVLEAGIRIIAQPPGKKLQNMMQLSGGEKALTAISLLFAIQNLKPSPFCLLDEIEAALDDSNVDRFAKYLHKLTKHTQFIVITHRRGTMTAADRLYGITMQEKGVSTLVSVDLLEKDLDD